MTIKQLQLKNFRLFEDLSIDFDERLNIFLGVNGAGKSALLDSIAILLSGFVARLWEWREANGNMYFIQENDIHHGKENTEVTIKAAHNQHLWQWQLSSNKNRNNINEIKKIAATFLTELESNPLLLNIPILIYYNYRRNQTLKRKTLLKVNFPQLLAYKNALSPTIESFNKFEEWFIEEEGYEDKIRLEKDNTYRNPKLQVVRNVLYAFLNQLGTAHFSNLKVKKDRRMTIYSTLVITKDSYELELVQLSAGEKLLLSTVIDIAHRLTLANPSLTTPLEGEGIILIDEVDLHLHPQWQRYIVPALLATFPKIQFIITTHSPQVLSKIEKKHIFIIENGKIIKNPPNTYGKDTNTLLNTIFKTDERPSDIKQKLMECARLFDTGNITQGNMILKELTAILGEDDPEIIEAKTFLHFYSA